MDAKIIHIEMKFNKSTKNTHVYMQDCESPAVPTLYIRKEAMPDTPPPAISVAIQFKE